MMTELCHPLILMAPPRPCTPIVSLPPAHFSAQTFLEIRTWLPPLLVSYIQCRIRGSVADRDIADEEKEEVCVEVVLILTM
jgi:hypothetical protein